MVGFDPYLTAKNAQNNSTPDNTGVTVPGVSTINAPQQNQSTTNLGNTSLTGWSYDPTDGLIWNNQTGYSLIGNESNQASYYTSATQGGPASLTEFINDYETKLYKQQGAVSNLREKLINQGWINGQNVEASKALSASNPNVIDTVMLTAMYNVAASASAFNFSNAKSGSKNFNTFDEYLNKTKSPQSGSTSGGGGAPSRTVTINRLDIRPEDYRKALDDTYMELTGKGATDKELNVFIKNLKKLEAANPSKTVTSRHGNTTVSSSTGGLSSEQVTDMQREQALSDPNSENYVKATKFMDYFMNSLGTNIELGA